MTSLNGLGFSISILKLQDTGLKHSMLGLLDSPAECTGWAAAIKTSTWEKPRSEVRDQSAQAGSENTPSGLQLDPQQANKVLKHALGKLIEAEPDITKYDTVVGDGDCGTGLKRGAEGVLEKLNDEKDSALYVNNITSVVEEKMDGTSGAIYAIFLNALASGLREQAENGAKQADAKVWGAALEFALTSMSKYTPAKLGDRTLVDALAPFVDTLNWSGDIHKAADAAEEGAQRTKGMKASLGRTVYGKYKNCSSASRRHFKFVLTRFCDRVVGGSGYEEVPDPGAYGLAIFLKGLAEGLK